MARASVDNSRAISHINLLRPSKLLHFLCSSYRDHVLHRHVSGGKDCLNLIGLHFCGRERLLE